MGVVLAGGQSIRMGEDKGLLLYERLTWAQLAFNRLTSMHLPVRIVINQQQLSSYRAIFPDRQLTIDNPHLTIGGPLKGILTVHLLYPQEDLFIIACDMIDMQVDLLAFLIEIYNDRPVETLVPVNNKQPEPLCGIYSANALDKIYDLFINGCLGKHSMKYVLANLDTRYLPVSGVWTNYFTNCNTQKDLALALAYK
ncbi:MAG: molybdenum cofactor guanylyltransferase [Chitinophagaceae bacterium]